MNSLRSLSLAVSTSNATSQIAALLYTLGYIHNNETIVDIRIKGWDKEVIPLELTIRKDREEVQVITHTK